MTELTGNHAWLSFEYNTIVNAIPNKWNAQMNQSMNRFQIKPDILMEAGLINTLSNKKL